MSTTATPVFAAIPTGSSIGNVLAYATLANGGTENTGAFLDLTSAPADWQASVDITSTTGGTAASTSGCSITCYHVIGSATTSTTITGGTTTSITVSAANGIHAGMKIAISGSGGAEVVTVTSISGTTVTLTAAPINSYTGTTTIYIIGQTAPFGVPTLGQNLTAANTTYGTTIYLPTDTYFISLTNLDAPNNISVEITSRLWPGVISQ